MARFLSPYVKVSFEILLAKIKNLPDSYFYFQKIEIFAFKMIQVLFRLDLKICE